MCNILCPCVQPLKFISTRHHYTIPDEKLTVMGPGGEEGPVSTLSPPKFSDDDDKLVWPEAIDDWSEKVLDCAESGDNKAKGIPACLELTLYRSLPLGTEKQIKQSVWRGEIKMTPADEIGSKEQIELVQKILGMVEKDVAVDRISRIVMINTPLHKCVHRLEDKLK